MDAIEQMGELEDTLVIWIWGDNGSSMEGTVTGSFDGLTTARTWAAPATRRSSAGRPGSKTEVRSGPGSPA